MKKIKIFFLRLLRFISLTTPIVSPGIKLSIDSVFLSQKKMLPQSLPLITYSEFGPKKFTPFIVL